MNLFEGEPALAKNELRGLGRAIAGGGDKVNRRGNDFYPTPSDATEALLRVEASYIEAYGLPVWEPCGRGGAISTVLQRHGFETVATDIVADPVHDVTVLNVLLAEQALSPVAFTNPPFALAAPIIKHLLITLNVEYLALLLKATFWSAATRRALLDRCPVSRRYDLTWRLDFTDGGSPTMECSWFVWDRRSNDSMRWEPLPRPKAETILLL